MEMGIGMKNLRPVDTADTRVPPHSAAGFTTTTPEFNLFRKLPCNSRGEAMSRFFSIKRLMSCVPCWMLPVVLVMSICLTFSVPDAGIAQQISPELQEAVEYQQAGKLKDAIESYTDYLANHPRSTDALDWRGMAYDDLHEPAKALQDFNKAIQIDPNYADAYNNRGEIYRKQKKYRQALNDYRKATEFDRNFPEAYFNMGLVQEAEKRNKLAIQAFSTYLRLSPNASDKQQVLEKIETLKKSLAQAQPKPHPGTPSAAAPTRRPAKPLAAVPKPGERPGVHKLGERPGVHRPGVIPGFPMKPGTAFPGFPVKPGHSPIPGMTPQQLATAKAFVAAYSLISLIIGIAVDILLMAMIYLIGKKTATPLSWLAFVPIGLTQGYVMVKASGKPLWWLALLLILPIVPVLLLLPPLHSMLPDPRLVFIALGAAMLVCYVIWLLVCMGIARERGKSPLWGILLWLPCTNVIALIYLGLSR
jgi:tetratricopeptide (TPR) repeat protein